MKKIITTILALILFTFSSCKNNREKTVKANTKIFLVLDITVYDSIMYE